MKNRLFVIVTALFGLVLSGITSGSVMADEAPRISKEEVIKMLDDPDVLIVDVRIGRDWKASEFKIKGAIRRDPFTWGAPDYPKDKTIIFYCA